MPSPNSAVRTENVKALQRFLGFVNYLAKFVPHLSDECEPLRRLTDKDAAWVWEMHHQQAFDRIKKLVAAHPVLRYYDVKQPVTIQCDSSETGLGAALLQGGQPVAYASRTLTMTERRYAQIEKECLAILFACERFDQYIYARDVITIHTDHKPLETIFTKPLMLAPKRLQGMLLRLQKFNLHVVYKKGAEMYLADTLSRAPLPEMYPPRNRLQPDHEEVCRVDLEQVNAAEYLRISRDGLQNIQRLTERDKQLQSLKTIVLRGWPETKQEVDPKITEYWNYRDEIGVQNGVIYKGDRVIIPSELRREMIQRIHASHQGEQASLRRAREVIFWPGMNHQIKDTVSQCSICAEYAPTQQKEPLLTHELPTRPWSTVAQDLYCFNGRDYLLTVDAFSGFWEVDELRSTTAGTVVQKTKQHFARYGIPDKVYTDNGPQFDCTEFTKFAQEWQFEHYTSSPYHAQSNGLVEAAVKTAKSLQKKAAKAHQDPWLSFLAYRNTPSEGMDSSPAQRLMSRRTRTTLPIATHLLSPEVQAEVEAKLAHKRRRSKKYYDTGSKELPELEIGQPVRMQSEGGKWRRGICNAKVAPRSYVLEVDGDLYRRNRRHIRPDSTSTVQTQEDTEVSKGMEQESPESSPSLEKCCLPPVQEVPESANLENHRTPVKAGATSGEHLLQPEAQMAVAPRMTTCSGREIKPPSRLISSM